MWGLVLFVFLMIIAFGIITFLFIRDGLFIKKDILVYNLVQVGNPIIVKNGGTQLSINFGSSAPMGMRVSDVLQASLDGGQTFPLQYTLKNILVSGLYVFPDGIFDDRNVFLLSVSNESATTAFSLWIITSSGGVPATVPQIDPSSNAQIFSHVGQKIRIGPSTDTFENAPFNVTVTSPIEKNLIITDSGASLNV